MNLRFELTTRDCMSWYGNFSRCGYYAFRDIDKATADKLDGTVHHYQFDAAGSASVEVKKERKCKTQGFRGYDWMIDEILEYGEIKKSVFSIENGGYDKNKGSK